MKPEELRRGNNVFFDSEMAVGKYPKIVTIETNGVRLDNGARAEGGEIHCTGIIPFHKIFGIELTEKILLGCGLLKNDYENVILIDDFYTLRYFDFDKYHDKSGWYLYVNYVEYETSTVIVYVHEFQDLYFALKRKEINISL